VTVQPASSDERWLRRAGHGRLPDGRRLTWTVAEGRRGLRWRSTTVTPGGRLEASLLLEARPDGDLLKVELATRAGLLSVHPEAQDDMLHGNVVTPDGMRHIQLPWTPASVLLVQDSPLTGAVAARRLGTRIGVGEGHTVAVVEVGIDLTVELATWRVARVAEARWWLLPAAGGTPMRLEVDDRGIPVGLADERDWPLEQEAPQ
jgi:hypothetical protein